MCDSNFLDKIEELHKTMRNGGLGGAGSVKTGNAVLPTRINLPKTGNNSNATKVKIPSVAQPSKKDPVKSIQQIHNKDVKDIKMKEALAQFGEVTKTLPNGQWFIETINKKERCWEGYEPTPGKKPYEKGSCQPIKKKECDCNNCDC
jgi:hypothetical protein